MPAKRAASARDGAVKQAKAAQVLSKLVKTQDQLEFQKDLKALTDDLKKNPSKLKRVQAAASCEDGVAFDPEVSFNPILAGKSIQSLPPYFLAGWLPTLGGVVTATQYKKALKKDKKVCHKVLQRVCALSKHQVIGPIVKEIWMQLYGDRARAMGNGITNIVLGANGDIAWDVGNVGLASFGPPVPPETEPKEHKYEYLTVLNVRLQFPADMLVTGEWKIANHWDIEDLCIFHPAREWNMMPVLKVFSSEIQKFYTPLALPAASSAPTQPPLKAIEDEPTTSRQIPAAADAGEARSSTDAAESACPREASTPGDDVGSCVNSENSFASQPASTQGALVNVTPRIVMTPPSAAPTSAGRVAAALRGIKRQRQED